jgi:hypothetical protein
MKALHDRTSNPQSQNAATELAACVAVIFEKYPILCGFTVQPHATLTTDRAIVRLQRGLYLADVEVSSPPGFRATPEFCNQIAFMLIELIDEQPKVLDLLPGRTFARTWH